jgi:hypothetical protein
MIGLSRIVFLSAYQKKVWQALIRRMRGQRTGPCRGARTLLFSRASELSRSTDGRLP